MKKQAENYKSQVEFNEGDWVLLKLEPYRQKSIHKREIQNLSRRYFGPFQILKIMGSVAYKLDLPSNSKMHPVFHVSLLQKFRGDLPSKPLPLPLYSEDHHPILKPLAILDRRNTTRSIDVVDQVPV